MLVLTRKRGEKIVIDGDIEVTIVDIRGNHVRLGIQAPKEISVLREELVEEWVGAQSVQGYEDVA